MVYHRLLQFHHLTKPTISKMHFSITPFNSSFHHSPNKPQLLNTLPTSKSPTLTPQELTKINLLIPQLCNSNQLPTALHLTKTALSSNPPLHSLNLSPLINSLTSHHHLTHTISLLTHLFHTPHYISPISLMLLSSYLNKRSTNQAFYLFKWLQRLRSPSPPDVTVFRLVIPALCNDGFILHALGAFRDMVHGGTEMETLDCLDCGKWLYRGLLSEARVNQALELNNAILILARDPHERVKVLHVLDRIIADWTV